jgi:hypothetical protein
MLGSDAWDRRGATSGEEGSGQREADVRTGKREEQSEEGKPKSAAGREKQRELERGNS